ncbi:hypothetical protein MKW92_044865 [Papaver armeniacum]|nr:hypothetical protein MKW92_044865 [Papaver armeniacum]
MEETKNKNGNKQNRKKIQVVKGGGGGIGVVLLWGGVFAVATFVVTLINKRNKKRLNFPTDDDKKKSNRTNCNAGEEEERNEGLRSLLQTQTPISDPHLCYTGISIGNNVIKMGSAKEDELRTVATCGDLKTVNDLNDLVKDRVVTVESAKEVVKDSLSEMEMCKSGQDKSNKEDCFEDSISVEAVKEVGGAVELPVTAHNVRCQDGNPKMLLEDSTEDEEDEDNDEEDYEDEELEEEDEDDIYDDDESIEGKGDEDSEGTGESSRESNAEAIWPAELIEEHQHLELKKGNDQIINEEGTKKLEVAWKGNADILQQGHAGEKETGCMMMGNCASLILISKSRLRMWSSLTVGLLIIAIVHHLLVSSFLNLNISL